MLRFGGRVYSSELPTGTEAFGVFFGVDYGTFAFYEVT